MSKKTNKKSSSSEEQLKELEGEFKSLYPEDQYDDDLEPDYGLKKTVDAAIRDTREVIKIYCKAEDLDANDVDFSIWLDWDTKTSLLKFKAENVHEAESIIATLVKRGYPKYLIRLRDDSSEKGILDIVLFKNEYWGVGLHTNTEEELDEWANRNRQFTSSQDKSWFDK